MPLAKAQAQKIRMGDFPNYSLFNGNFPSGLYSYRYNNSKDLVSSIFVVGEYKYKNNLTLSGTLRQDAITALSNNLERVSNISLSSNYTIISPLKNITFINSLNLRASYGQFKSPLQATSYQFYQPEKVNIINTGLSLRLGKGMFELMVDYFDKTSQNLYFYLQMPPSLGFGNFFIREGNIRNSGFELTSTFQKTWKNNVRVNIQSNVTFLKNKLDNITELDNFVTLKSGYPTSSWFGLQTNGIWTNLQEIKNSPQELLPYLGGNKYIDINNDGRIDQLNDNVHMGSANPKILFGLNSQISLNGFDFSASFRCESGQRISNLSYNYIGPEKNITQYVYNNLWRLDNPQGTWAPTQLARHFEDASFLRLQDVIMGYTFSNNKMSYRLYINCQNLFLLTKYSGQDPEVNEYGQNAYIRGVDNDAYPRSKNFSFGLQVTF